MLKVVFIYRTRGVCVAGLPNQIVIWQICMHILLPVSVCDYVWVFAITQLYFLA